MSLDEIAAEVGQGLLTQLPSTLLAALIMTGLAAISRKRRRGRSPEEGEDERDSA